MQKFFINGGFPLKGTVALDGAKNASFKLLVASLLADQGEVRLSGLPMIGDVINTIEIIKKLGGKAKKGEFKSYIINPKDLNSFRVPQKLASMNRAPIVFAGPLLSRFCKAILPFPGGDRIGRRPLDRHFEALKSLGVGIKVIDGCFMLYGDKVRGNDVTFKKNTHMGTEVLIMTAVKAKGTTIIRNAALEPEVDDLINFLNKMGAEIRREREKRIIIKGVEKLKAINYQVMPDRNEAVTFACAALGTKGDIMVERARPQDLKIFLKKVQEIGGGVEIQKNGIRFFYKKELTAVKITTKPHPGFMTDWQPLWTTLMTQAKGVSQVIETVFPNRLSFIREIKKMGGDFRFFNPKVKDKDTFYNFNLKDDKKTFFHGVKIYGPKKIHGIKTKINDLRSGATLVLASLIAEGRSELTNIGEIDRGYDSLDKKLLKLKAKIRRFEQRKDLK